MQSGSGQPKTGTVSWENPGPYFHQPLLPKTVQLCAIGLRGGLQRARERGLPREPGGRVCSLAMRLTPKEAAEWGGSERFLEEL